MAVSRIFHLIVGNHLEMELEDVLVDHSPGRKYSCSLLWYVFLLVIKSADVQIFQSFDIRPHNLEYKLQIKHTITLKPRDFYMHASARKGRDINTIIGISAKQADNKEVNGDEHTNGTTGKVDLSVFYGQSV